MFLQKSIGNGLAIAFHVSEGFRVSIFGVSLQSYSELTSQISALSVGIDTMGLEVV